MVLHTHVVVHTLPTRGYTPQTPRGRGSTQTPRGPTHPKPHAVVDSLKPHAVVDSPKPHAVLHTPNPTRSLLSQTLTVLHMREKLFSPYKNRVSRVHQIILFSESRW